MATNVDFDNLIERIEIATETLESDVVALATSAESLETAVEEAELAAANSEASALAAAASVIEVDVKADEVDGKLAEAEALVTSLEASVILQEAPVDGFSYVRKDAAWALNESVGTVLSVNEVEPAEDGNITLTASDVGARPDSYVPAWSEVTGKPSFATVATTGAYSDLTGTPAAAPSPVMRMTSTQVIQAGVNIINQMNGTATFATMQTTLTTYGLQNGFVFHGKQIASQSNIPAGTLFSASCYVTDDGSGGIGDFYVILDVLTGTNAGKRYYSFRNSNTARAFVLFSTSA